MSFRIEEKLYIRPENLFDFRIFLNKKNALNLYHPRIIESLYFDTYNLDIYNDSIEGLTPRKKIRVRNYPEDKEVIRYLEIKNSSVEGRHKVRKIINQNLYQNYQKKGFFDLQYGLCFPKVYVRYKREYAQINDVRISIDTNLSYRNFENKFQSNDGRIIVELKTSFKKNLDELIKDFPIQRIRFSKYSYAIECLKIKNFS
jgi:SPX domain protein involved in polyphosphate accumulation